MMNGFKERIRIRGGIMADRISVWLIIKAHSAQELVLAGYL